MATTAQSCDPHSIASASPPTLPSVTATVSGATPRKSIDDAVACTRVQQRNPMPLIADAARAVVGL